MTWVATAIIASSAIGVIGANAAADTQASASQAATAAQQGMFNQTVANERPFMTAGQTATGAMDYLLGIGGNNTANAPAGGGGYGSLMTPFTADMMKQYKIGRAHV